MSMLGISSAYSAYSAGSVYSINPVSPINDKQDSSNEENPTISAVDNDINDEAIISDRAKALYEEDKVNNDNQANNQKQDSSNNQPDFTKELTQGQQQEVNKLKARDLEVKTHEQAHISAAAGLSTSAPTYEYQVGPDGKRYAIGGEVNISFVESKDPEANITNAEKMKNAALAPAEPSGQDYSVARNADSIIAQAQKELSQQKTEESKTNNQTSDQTESLGTTADSSETTIEQPSANQTSRVSKVPVSGLSQT